MSKVRVKTPFQNRYECVCTFSVHTTGWQKHFNNTEKCNNNCIQSAHSYNFKKEVEKLKRKIIKRKHGKQIHNARWDNLKIYCILLSLSASYAFILFFPFLFLFFCNIYMEEMNTMNRKKNFWAIINHIM